MAARFLSFPSIRCAPPLIALIGALAAGGCQPPDVGGMTSTIGMREPPPPSDEGALRAYVATMEPRYGEHPENKAIAMNYATALRGLTQHAQAAAVLQKLAVTYPHDMSVLAAYGKALADAGRLQEAAAVLEHAHTPERPNWSVLSAQGSVADQMGDHAQAQNYYTAALKIVPRQPQVLSNLGLSYALEHRMPEAEATLREAVAQPGADRRVRQNLALILTLESKYAQAEDISRRDLPPIDAAENVASIRQTIAQSDTWKPQPHAPTRAAARADRTQTATRDDIQ